MCDRAAELDEAGDEDDGDDAGIEGKGKLNRNEKKARKALSKLGLKAVPGVNRVTVKKSKQILFVINRPDVFKAPGSETFVIFGEAKAEDMAGAGGAADAFARPAPAARAGAPAAPAAAAAAADAGAAEEEGAVDETGIDAKDIELVMAQAGTTRAKAVKALRKSNNDIVSAIMELTL